MTDRKLILSKRALRDLDRLEEYILSESYPAYAISFINLILKKCQAITGAPMQGEPVEPSRTDLRKVGLKKRVSILFRVTESTVIILLSIAYAGRRHETRK